MSGVNHNNPSDDFFDVDFEELERLEQSFAQDFKPESAGSIPKYSENIESHNGGNSLSAAIAAASAAVSGTTSSSRASHPSQGLKESIDSSGLKESTVDSSGLKESTMGSSGCAEFCAGDTLLQTLNNFGLPSFRSGQEDVITAALSGKDTAVFWATGLGKSLCYQIPALHAAKTTIVISPLISLMQDQCIKLNNLCRRKVAVFLGSAQSDWQTEVDAVSGRYQLVYCTPEKIAQSGFLHTLGRLHANQGIALFAVDEAHCVTEWGHDFRPSYRILHLLRDHEVLRNVPIMALTATAVPRVRDDICEQLKLRSPLVFQSSFDRPNLRVEILRKPATGGLAAALHGIVCEMKQKPLDNSTIIYSPTKSNVNKIAESLSASLNGICKVLPYHADLSHEQRSAAHVGYLTGEVQVVVATVAFGMGIDKPDTRRVIHLGAPKTTEEYYQQIGRAGRDGLPALAVMYCDLQDFSLYRSDFYLGGLNETAKASVLRSLESLQKLSIQNKCCRRKMLLGFFGEEASFGERCGNCDVCTSMEVHGEEFERDFQVPARVLCQALALLKPVSMTVLEKVIAGKEVEEWRWMNSSENGIASAIELVRKASEVQGARTIPNLCRSLIPLLVNEGYINEINQKNGAGRVYLSFGLTPKGRNLVNNKAAPCMLPVPDSVRQAERDAKEERAKTEQSLKAAGISIAAIPEHELAQGHGEVLNSFKYYFSALESARNSDPSKADALVNLTELIQSWRSTTAVALSMAPAAVLPQHLLYSIAFAASRSPLTEGQLRDFGVRIQGTDKLATIISDWCEKNGVNCVHSSGREWEAMIDLPTQFQPSPWLRANYVAGKPWERSSKMFSEGKSLVTIANFQGNLKSGEPKKPILVTTAGNHILDGLPFGRYNIDLDRLVREFTPPTRTEWNQLKEAEEERSTDVTEVISINKSDFLQKICPSVTIPFPDRNDYQKGEVTRALRNLSWYIALRRCGFEPRFADLTPSSTSGSGDLPSKRPADMAPENDQGERQPKRLS